MQRISGPLQKNLNTRLTALFLFIGLIPLLITVGITIFLTNNVLRDVAIEDEQARVQNEADIIDRFLATTVDDLALLRNSNTMQDLVSAIADRNSLDLQRLRRQLEQEFVTYMENRTFRGNAIYEHIRFLDENGFEFVRIDNIDGGASSVFSVNLNSRSNTAYFQATKELQEGEIYVSALELFNEFGVVQTPHTPVIRYAAPIYGEEALIGVLVLDVRAQGFLDLIQEHSNGSTFLLDADGYYLLHNDPSKTFGRDLNTNVTIESEKPDLEFLLSEAGPGVHETDDEITFYRIVIPQGQSDRYWVLASTVSLDSILSLVRQQQTVLFISLLVVGGLVLIIALFFARSISQPVVQMTDVAIHVADGDLQRLVQISGDDEIGRLGTAFNRMTQQLRELITGLEDRVRERTSELEEARLEAERANDVKSQFLASMSHELRTPLNGIINFTGFVLDGMLGPINEKQSKFLGDVVSNSEHLLALINDVLDISKIESGSLKLYIEEDINLNEEMQKVLRTGEGLLNDKPVNILTHIPKDLPRVSGDKRRINQIMLNLISNACKFTDEGTITVSASQENGFITFTVKDSGPGIAPEDHKAVFENFKQTETGLRQGGGSGLGLPISRKLAEAHGGQLWFESERDQGTTFFVKLPIQSPELQRETMP
jgi:signal transduction histidine kinase